MHIPMSVAVVKMAVCNTGREADGVIGVARLCGGGEADATAAAIVGEIVSRFCARASCSSSDVSPCRSMTKPSAAREDCAVALLAVPLCDVLKMSVTTFDEPTSSRAS